MMQLYTQKAVTVVSVGYLGVRRPHVFGVMFDAAP